MVFHQDAVDRVEGETIEPSQVGTSSNKSTVEADTTTTDDLDIAGNDFVASGEVLPLDAYGPVSTRSDSTTATSYSTLSANLIFQFVQWDTLPGNTVIGLTAQLRAGSSETVYSRVRNATDSESILNTEISSSQSSEKLWSGWVDYDPTTTASPIELRIEGKTDSGTSSDVFSPVIRLGVQL